VVVEQPQSTRVQGADIVMQSFGPDKKQISGNRVIRPIGGLCAWPHLQAVSSGGRLSRI